MTEFCKQMLGNRMEQCEDCGEYLIGDGYTSAISCPNADVDGLTPDGDVVYCDDRVVIKLEDYIEKGFINE